MTLLLLLACNGDPNLNVGVPNLECAPASIDFGETVATVGKEIGINCENSGYGVVEFNDVSIESESTEFSVTEYPEEGLGAGETGVLSVLYVPVADGGAAGEVLLTTNSGFATAADAEGAEPMSIPIEGIGVTPCLDLDPSVLYFGVVTPQESKTLEVEVRAACTGTLRILHMELEGDDGAVYSFDPGDIYIEPYPLSNGYSFTVAVTFTPPDTERYEAELRIETNDPDDPISVVELIGNTDDEVTENTAPYVEILEPNNGDYFMSDVEVALEGYVADPDDVATNLVCTWMVGPDILDAGVPDEDGRISSEKALPIGEIDLDLRCIDTDDGVGSDSVSLTVWEAEEPVLYTISGGDSVYDYFSVDDDVTFTLNGVEFYADSNRTQDTLPPVEFEAQRGDVLGIVAVDHNECDTALDALVLHWGAGESQALNDAICDSSCPEHGCYDGTYNGPWPGTVLDEQYTIAIP